MKWFMNRVLVNALRRSPCGERGLKCARRNSALSIVLSLPVRGAWIEILRCWLAHDVTHVAPRAGSVD